VSLTPAPPEPAAATTTIGFIYPDHAAEDDYPLAEQLLGGDMAGIRLPVEHIYGTDLHAVPELLDLGSERRLAEGAALLTKHEPAAVVWACTSGSFVYGWEGARRQAAEIEEALELPASSTSLAYVEALRALGLRRVAITATYPEDIARRFADFLGAAGLEPVAVASRGIVTAAEVGTLEQDEALALIGSVDGSAADAVLLPDTALHTIESIEALERAAGKPVLTANQVSAWEGLRLAGADTWALGLGRLFAA
jgi:maleate cis-trans isomerase